MAKANNLELELIERAPDKEFPPEYLKLNPLNRVPSFEGTDGYVLTECMAIAVYGESLDRAPSLRPRTSFLQDETYYIILSYPCLKLIC